LPNEPFWLSPEHLIDLNRELVAVTGEPHGLRDSGLLESAAAKPINHFHYGEQDMVVLAITLLLGVGRNHPFVQGNKRTPFAAAEDFLHLNGYELAAPDSEAFADLIVSALTGQTSEHRLVEEIGRHVVLRP
jgi:death-on-curing protein